MTTTRTFCGTITVALGNILALMLTLLSLSASTDIRLKKSFYNRIKQISWMVAVVLSSAILLNLLLNIPLNEVDTSSGTVTWYAYLYYVTLVVTSLIGGALIAVVLMLYHTLKNIIQIFIQERQDNSSDTSSED